MFVPYHSHRPWPLFSNVVSQVFCELFGFRLPSDLDARALKLRKRAFWASLAVVFYAVVWRHWVRRKPLTIVRAVTNAGVSTLWLGMGTGRCLRSTIPKFIIC